MKKESMVVNLAFFSSTYEKKPNTAFIIIPFTEEWSKDVSDTIVNVCKKHKVTAVRADNIFDTKRSVLEDIWKGIYESELIIADITKQNANVFYELGLAHALGKDVILLRQKDGDPIPFDILGRRYIQYKTLPSSFKKFKQDITSAIRNFFDEKNGHIKTDE